MAIEIFNSANSMFIIQDCPEWLNTLKEKPYNPHLAYILIWK